MMLTFLIVALAFLIFLKLEKRKAKRKEITGKFSYLKYLIMTSGYKHNTEFDIQKSIMYKYNNVMTISEFARNQIPESFSPRFRECKEEIFSLEEMISYSQPTKDSVQILYDLDKAFITLDNLYTELQSLYPRVKF